MPIMDLTPQWMIYFCAWPASFEACLYKWHSPCTFEQGDALWMYQAVKGTMEEVGQMVKKKHDYGIE